MPGNVAGVLDAPLDIFGGLVTDMAASDLPLGVSPDCADVKFIQGGVQTRPGLLASGIVVAGNPTINYLKTFVDLSGNFRMMYLDSLGQLWQDFPQGTETLIKSALAVNSYARSATLFGREYIAISDGKPATAGNELPWQWDNTQLDRVSQVGPGAGPPQAADAAAEAPFTIAAAPTGAVRDANNNVTITTTASHGYAVGQNVAIAGVADASFNGPSFAIVTVPSATTFTYGQVGPASNSGGGTATLQPKISAGQHQVALIFKTRQGYLTRPSVPISYQSAGGRRAKITQIPLGPANVVARILAFTVAGGASFFYTKDTLLNDNTTTTLFADFSDSELLASTNVDYLFRLVELGECAGFIDYGYRLFAWGERNKANNWLNLTFDGGWPVVGTAPPLGWTLDPTFGSGGTQDTTNAAWGSAYRITGDAVIGTRGMITQPAVKDYLGVALIAPATAYSVRARVMKGGGLTQGTLHVHLFGTGVNTAGLQVTAAQAGTAFAEFTATLTAALTTIPSDLVLRVYVDGTPAPAGGFFVVDNIEIFPSNQPANLSVVRASRTNDAESFDGVNGFLQVAPNNGQAIRACFRLREKLYFVKEHSLYATQDDGVNEPAGWSIAEISSKVGTPAAAGVDVAEEWAIIANREGLYIFWGPEPVKISQEIQPTWDQINWQYGHTLWVKIDTQNKRILVGVPFGVGVTSPNRVLMMDYRGLGSAEEIAAHASIHFSSFTGKLFAVGRARKWAPWLVAANSAALVERTDGTAQMFLGNGAGNGKIYQLSDTTFSDDGAAIASYYTTYFFLHHELEQALGLGSHRKLFSYLTTFVEGAGTLSLTAYVNTTGAPSAQQPFLLSNPSTKDLEMPINILGERVAFKVGTNAVGAWFKLQKFVPSLRGDPWAPVRGVN